MGITGNLKTMELSELLQWLSQGRKTGTLYISAKNIEKKIFFEKGDIVSSAASDPKEHLGHFLVSHGFLDEETLAKAMDMQEANRMLLGKILVTIGAISEEDLERMLRLKAEESIYDIFTWPEGDFRFIDGELPAYTMVPLSISAAHLILEGHRRLDEWQRIRTVIPSIHMIPVAVGELESSPADPGVEQVLALVNDDRTVQEIALQTHSSEFFVCRILYDQARRGRLKLIRPRQMTVERPIGSDQEVVDAQALLRVAEEHIEKRRFDVALRHLGAANSLEPDSQQTLQTVDRLRRLIEEAVTSDGIHKTTVPKLNRSLEDLDSLDISPQEGFVLTRIDGSYDIQTLLKITPLPPLEAKVVFWNLLQAEHITLQDKDNS